MKPRISDDSELGGRNFEGFIVLYISAKYILFVSHIWLQNTFEIYFVTNRTYFSTFFM